MRRAPARARYERAAVERILDAGLVAHLGVADEDGQPFVIPMLYARVADQVYVHGATSSRLVRRLTAGAPGCLTVTVVDGLVLARSIFHHSTNYRSVVVLGGARAVTGRAEKLRALHAFSAQMVPGRWD
ncbi:MAG: pyridoxamine 5'-phosphate oxidase family protein, partial [Actinobacteria bacterium]|nr:pyridoxamine 5'-phosphate oxidase family protein [Actinomycetota bacterium]